MSHKAKHKAKHEDKPWLKFYPEGVPAEIEVQEKSLPQVFDEAVAKWKDKTAVIFYGKKISYRELKDHVDRFAAALCDLGVKKGDVVALLLLNSPQFIIAYFGALKAGATITSISPVYVSPEIKHQIEDSGATTIICLDVLYDRVESSGVNLEKVILTNITEYLPALKKFLGQSVLRVVYQKMSAPSPEIFEREGIYKFQDLIKKYPPQPPQIEINPKQDVATLPYTGGTTGTPKGAMITHYNLLADELQTYLFMSPALKEGKELIIAYLPFYHIYGQAVLMVGGLVRGYTLVIFTAPDPGDILDAISKYSATAFFSVPSMYEYLNQHEKTEWVDWKRLKFVMSGADALLESTSKDWKRRTGVAIYEGYGQTESSGGTHFNPIGRNKEGSFGIPLPNTMAAVVDPQTLEFLPPGEIGEVIIKGPQVMKGYWRRPEESKNAFVEIDGEIWLRTSDLVSMDEEGYFYFYDRKRDLIKYKGLAVFAREIEEVLAAHPQIKAVGVIGVPDPMVGENIKAIVVLESDARGKLSEKGIMEYCEGKLAHYKVPKIVEFRGEIPKTDVGKVSRRELREELEEV